MAGVFNDIEVLFDKRRLFLPFAPPHIAWPYDFCEQVEGARRFILAHELAHCIFSDPLRPTRVDALIPEDLAKWGGPAHREEYWCDAFAIDALLRIYEGQPMVDTAFSEVENGIVGILLYFTILDIVNAALGEHLNLSADHPLPLFRREAIRHIVKSHPLYRDSAQLQRELCAKWRRLNAFRLFTGGVNAPIFFQANSLWSYPDFLERLTDFGHTAYRRNFDAVRTEVDIFYDGDLEALNADHGEF